MLGFGGKRTLGRHRHRWKNSIKMDWIVMGQDRNRFWAVVTAVMNVFLHKMCGIFD
jgi:hypothetical protein